MVFIMEVWKPIPHAPQYLCSNFGNVKSLRYQTILKGSKNSCGYKRVQIGSSKNKHFVHRLVAECFLDAKDGTTVNHKDGNKDNNHVDNLEWCTMKSNNNHAIQTGLRIPVKGEKHRWISAGEAIEDLGNKVKGLFLVTAGDERHVKAFQRPIHDPYSQPAPTLTATNNSFDLISKDRKSEERAYTFNEYKRLGSFPDDYQAKTDKIGKYMIGMSVPPRMTEQVAKAVIGQWF
jgi:site-specific DNA-cytosine methylase